MTEHQDKAEIIEVLNLYAFALDSHRWELFDRVFTEDVTADYGPGAVWSPLTDYVSVFVDIHTQHDAHQHTMVGHLVHVDGDKAHAFTYGNWLLIRHAVDGDPTWRGTGWYDDELVRTDRGWRIKHRIARVITYSGNPKVPGIGNEEVPGYLGSVLTDEVSGTRFFNAINAS